MTDAQRHDDVTETAAAEAADHSRPEEPVTGPATDPAADVGAGDAADPGQGEAAADGPHLDLLEIADADPRDRVELLGELLTAEAKRDEYLDDLRRSHADFENYRRRVVREGAIQREHGKADVVQALLDVLDDLDRTLEASADTADPALAKGVELVAGKLAHALQGLGVERLDASDVPFDPTRHEAVQQRPAEAPRDEPVVAQVLRPGYLLGDRVLRAAMVVVEQ